jgi:GT2 family glycosyltransferase
VAFTDDDCVPAPDWLERGLAHFTADVATVQGRTLPDPSQPTERWSATQRLESFTGRYETCNVFYRADALRRVGGFDESLGFFGEDIVAGWAVRRLGGGERFAGDAVVHHAVVDAGLGWFLCRTRFYENWSAVVRRFPEMRAEHLWCRYFLRRRSAGFALAVAGIVLGTWRRPLLLLALPYAWYRRPRLGYPESVRGSAEGVVFDAYVFAALVRGSIRHRCVVL